MNYYNDHAEHASVWLKQLVADGLITRGVVDSRDVREVKARDVERFRQCHFFAGIGGWPHAQDLAGWPRWQPIWTASLPCQPFSDAGLNRGVEDARHLWPDFRKLVEECRPAALVGEQVGSRNGRDWLAAVRADLEALGYAVGAADLCAAGGGAPHIRPRLYWAAFRLGNTEIPRWRQGGYDASSDTESGDGKGSERCWNDGGDDIRRGDVVYKPCLDGKHRPIQRGLQPMVDGIPERMVLGGYRGASLDTTPEARLLRLRGYGNAIVPQIAAHFMRSVMAAYQETT